ARRCALGIAATGSSRSLRPELERRRSNPPGLAGQTRVANEAERSRRRCRGPPPRWLCNGRAPEGGAFPTRACQPVLDRRTDRPDRDSRTMELRRCLHRGANACRAFQLPPNPGHSPPTAPSRLKLETCLPREWQENLPVLEPVSPLPGETWEQTR